MPAHGFVDLVHKHDMVVLDLCGQNFSGLTQPHTEWWFSKGNLLISGNLVKYYNLARFVDYFDTQPMAKHVFLLISS